MLRPQIQLARHVTASVHLCSQVLNGGGAAAMTPQCRDGLRAMEATKAVIGEREMCRCVIDCLSAHFPGALIGGVINVAQGAISELLGGCLFEIEVNP